MNFLKNNILRNNIILFGILFIALNILFSFCYNIQYRLYIWSDAEGYYQYLPYLFIKHDITHQSYAYYLENGMTMNKYTFGVAFMEMPFFLGAHAYSIIKGLQSDGYTSVYGFSLLLAASVYVYMGLVLLYKLILKFSSKLTAFISVFIIYFGTNLFYYTVCESGMSHAYSFFVLTWFLYSLDRFIQTPNFKNTLICGIPIALGVLIRPTNSIYLLLFLLYNVYSIKALKERFLFIFKNYKYFLLIAIIAFIVLFPQFYYWSHVAGKIVFYSYVNPQGEAETFKYISNPKLLHVLFGVESGWLIYSPVFLFFVAGMFLIIKKKVLNYLAILMIFAIILYINASWWAYTYACSFGYRSFIEYYPLFIIPMAYFFSKIFDVPKKYFQKTVIVFFLVIFSFTNIRMSLLYYKEKCWIVDEGFNWFKYNKVLNKVFFILPEDTSVK